MLERVLQQSSLARLLVHLYHSIKENSISHLVINTSLDLSLKVPRTSAKDSHGFGYLPFDPRCSIKDFPVLRPYHCLLLLHYAEEILRCLPLDASPLLYELIEVVTPTHR
jgi:hypothetical protein